MRAVTWAPSMGVTSPFRILLRRFDPMGGAKSSPYRRPARRKTAPWPILRVGKPRRGVVRARQLRRAPGRRLVQAARTLVGVRWRPSYSACARALGCTGHCGGGDRGGCGTVVVKVCTTVRTLGSDGSIPSARESQFQFAETGRIIFLYFSRLQLDIL